MLTTVSGGRLTTRCVPLGRPRNGTRGLCVVTETRDGSQELVASLVAGCPKENLQRGCELSTLPSRCQSRDRWQSRGHSVLQLRLAPYIPSHAPQQLGQPRCRLTMAVAVRPSHCRHVFQTANHSSTCRVAYARLGAREICPCKALPSLLTEGELPQVVVRAAVSFPFT